MMGGGAVRDKQRELQNCGFVKVVLMLLVIFGHSIHFWTEDWLTTYSPVLHSKGLLYLSHYISGFHVYAFALVSGYIFYYLRIERKHYERFWPFVKKKMKRLLVPYIFVALVWVIPMERFFFALDARAIFNQFVLASAPAHLWFLWMLFDVFMVAWPASDMMANTKWGGLILSIALYCAGMVGEHVFPNIFCIWRACRCFIFFWLGFELRRGDYRRLCGLSAWVYALVYTLLFAVHEMLPAEGGLFMRAVASGTSFLSNIAGVWMAFVLFQRLASYGQGKLRHRLGYLEKYAMPMYLIHQPIIYFTAVYLNGRINPYVHALLNFAAAFGLSISAGYVLMRHRTTRVLLGEE